jgi:hypothetical protein
MVMKIQGSTLDFHNHTQKIAMSAYPEIWIPLPDSRASGSMEIL